MTDRREQIAAAGLTLLATRGIRALTHRAIDEELGLPAGSTSYYARTKRDLVNLIVQRLAGSAGNDATAYEYIIMDRNKELKVHRLRLPGRSLCSIRSNRKWCKRRGSSLECQNCFFVYPIIDSNLKNLQGTIPCPLHHNYYVFASTNLNLISFSKRLCFNFLLCISLLYLYFRFHIHHVLI